MPRSGRRDPRLHSVTPFGRRRNLIGGRGFIFKVPSGLLSRLGASGRSWSFVWKFLCSRKPLINCTPCTTSLSPEWISPPFSDEPFTKSAQYPLFADAVLPVTYSPCLFRSFSGIPCLIPTTASQVADVWFFLLLRRAPASRVSFSARYSPSYETAVFFLLVPFFFRSPPTSVFLVSPVQFVDSVGLFSSFSAHKGWIASFLAFFLQSCDSFDSPL